MSILTTKEIIQLEGQQQEEEILLEEGMEVAIDLLLDPDEKKDREEHERKLQQLYKDTPFYQKLQQKIRAAALLAARIEAGEAVVCDKCGAVYEIGEWPLCGTGFGREHGRVTIRNAQTNTVTAYYINRHTGKIWIPGQNQYRKPIDRFGKDIPGYERHEVRNFRERDRFYKLMDDNAKQKYYSSLRREEQMFSQVQSENRKQMRQAVLSSESQSPEASYGREWLEKSIKKTEDAAKAKLNYSPNTHIEAWEFDQHNLDTANMDKLQETLSEKQPLLTDKQKKMIGRGISYKDKSGERVRKQVA